MAQIDDAFSDELLGPDDGLTLGAAPGGPDAPQLEVRAADGRLLQRVDLGAEPVAVGSHPGNGLVLEGDGVGRFHLRLAWDGAQAA